jgi:starch-binding outer membrane protein, SusD/RagB family
MLNEISRIMSNLYKIFCAKIILTFLILTGVGSCKKLVEVDSPITSTNAGNVYQNDGTASAVLTGIYAKLSLEDGGLINGVSGPTAISLYTALLADELTIADLNNLSFGPHFKNDLTPFTLSGVFWSAIYPTIFTLNSAIEGLTDSKTLTLSVKQQLLGEAKFMRAFCYFYLVNLYGDVPLVTGTDWKLNSLLSKEAKSKVYEQIVNDLSDAKEFLSVEFLNADAVTPYPILSAERIRPTKWAAHALLARVYLYTGNWAGAEIESSEVINNAGFFALTSLDSVFLKNNMEAVWQLQPVGTGPQANTGDGALFVLPPSGPNGNDYPVYLSEGVLTAFEEGDNRRLSWVDSVKPEDETFYYPKKYKIGRIDATTEEYIMMFRLGEQYLIRAEARANQDNLSGSIDDLDIIRERAGLPLIANVNPAIDKSDLLNAIFRERRVELFTEWGHRWFDLIRNNTIDATMNTVSAQKGGNWTPYKALLPIPADEIDRNPNLSQNVGY